MSRNSTVEEGFSLLESLVALLIAATLIGGVFEIYSDLSVQLSQRAKEGSILNAADNLLAEARASLQKRSELPKPVTILGGHLAVEARPYNVGSQQTADRSVTLMDVGVRYFDDNSHASRVVLRTIDIVAR